MHVIMIEHAFFFSEFDRRRQHMHTWRPLKLTEMAPFRNCTWWSADMTREAASRRQPMTPTTTANTLRCQEVTLAPPLAAFPCRSLPMLVAPTLPPSPPPAYALHSHDLIHKCKLIHSPIIRPAANDLAKVNSAHCLLISLNSHLVSFRTYSSDFIILAMWFVMHHHTRAYALAIILAWIWKIGEQWRLPRVCQQRPANPLLPRDKGDEQRLDLFL